MFLANNVNNDWLVAVHCTHGVNRTGYLICSYMIEKMGVFPKEAVERFGIARGHGIERINYLCDLLKVSREELESNYQFQSNVQKRINDDSFSDHQRMKYNNWRLEARHRIYESDSPASRNQYRSDFQRGRNDTPVRIPRRREFSDWRLECRQPENERDRSPVSSLCRPLPPPPQAPQCSRGPAESATEFHWTPDHLLRPPLFNKVKKVYTPHSTKPFKANIQLPHYGMPSVSYDRIRDDDQWTDEGALNKRTVQQGPRAVRYGRGRRGARNLRR